MEEVKAQPTTSASPFPKGNGTLTPTEARAILGVEAQTRPDEQSPVDVAPDEVMKRVGDLLTSLGYSGLGAILVTPKFGTPVNPYEFVPEGWGIRIVPVKAGSGG